VPVLLVVELDQNQDFARAQIRNEVFRGLADILPNAVDASPVIATLKEGRSISIEEALIAGGFFSGTGGSPLLQQS
jgi:hypothetical protein